MEQLNEQLDALLAATEPDKQQVIDFGNRALSAGRAFHATLRAFVESETRRGLNEEYDLIRSCGIHIADIRIKYDRLVGTPAEPLSADKQASIRDEMRDMAVQLLKERIAERFDSEGLRDILTAESWEEAGERVRQHARQKLHEYLDRETERIFGLSFHDGESARRALRMRLRREVRRQIGKLLIKVTSNSIIIDFATDTILRWLGDELWPKLKEALRPKGNHEARVEQSLGTLEAARRSLNELTGDAKIRDVQRQLNTAEGAMAATKYLYRDLNHAGRAELIERMDAAMAHLVRTVTITRHRFLLDKKDYSDDLDLLAKLLPLELKGIEDAIPEPDLQAGAVRYFIRDGYMLNGEQTPPRDGDQRTVSTRQTKLAPSLMYVDLEQTEQNRQRAMAAGRDLDRLRPIVVPHEPAYIMRIECNGQTRYVQYTRGKRRRTHYGAAWFHGLADGEHAVSVHVIDENGATFAFDYHIAVELKGGTSGMPRLESHVRRAQSMLDSDRPIEVKADNFNRGLLPDFRRAAQSILSREGGTPDDALPFLEAGFGYFEILLHRELKPERSFDEAARREAFVGAHMMYLVACETMCTPEAYDLAKRLIASAEPHAVTDKAQEQLAKMYQRMADMAITLNNDADEATQCMEKSIAAMRRGDGDFDDTREQSVRSMFPVHIATP